MGVEVPDQAAKRTDAQQSGQPSQLAHLLLGGAIAVGEGVQFVHQPFRMDPAQCVLADGKLSGIPRIRLRQPEGRLAQHHGIAQEVVRVNAAPNCSPSFRSGQAFGCDQHRIRGCGQFGEAEPVEMRRPGGLISEHRFRLLGQTAIRGADSARLRM